MTLAPYYVPWAFLTAISALLGIAMLWLVYPDPVRRILRRLWLGDGIALWLAFAASYHTLYMQFGQSGQNIGDSLALLTVWGTLAVYAILRILPRRLQSEPLLLAVGFAAWGWTIGTGIQFIDRMEEDALLLKERSQEVLNSAAPNLEPLFRAFVLSGLEAQKGEFIQDLAADLKKKIAIDPSRISLMRVVLIPRFLEVHRLEMTKLRTYQYLQMAMLAILLLAWGSGRLSRS